MDFFERFLGLSPDGGSGLTELSFLLVPILVALAIAVRRGRRKV